MLAQAAVEAFGKGATLNVGARNDAFGTALLALFKSEYTKRGGKIGASVSWNPDSGDVRHRGAEARRGQSRPAS